MKDLNININTTTLYVNPSNLLRMHMFVPKYKSGEYHKFGLPVLLMEGTTPNLWSKSGNI